MTREDLTFGLVIFVMFPLGTEYSATPSLMVL
jgi:hypothetical protein